MFSATKFLVAGAIVALFGGFLLVGLLTRQQSEEVLPAVGATASPSPKTTYVVSDISVAGQHHGGALRTAPLPHPLPSPSIAPWLVATRTIGTAEAMTRGPTMAAWTAPSHWTPLLP